VKLARPASPRCDGRSTPALARACDAKAKEGEQTPVYAMSFELYENGVSRALVLDYNDFVISGAMGKFDIKDNKDAKPCN
jgi:hypothetical protein